MIVWIILNYKIGINKIRICYNRLCYAISNVRWFQESINDPSIPPKKPPNAVPTTGNNEPTAAPTVDPTYEPIACLPFLTAASLNESPLI